MSVATAGTGTVAGVLRLAGGVLKERGWCQAAAEDPAGKVCAHTAIVIAAGAETGGTALRADALAALRRQALRADAVAALRRQVGQSVIGWNDTPGRTEAEVHAALSAAAASTEMPA